MNALLVALGLLTLGQVDLYSNGQFKGRVTRINVLNAQVSVDSGFGTIDGGTVPSTQLAASGIWGFIADGGTQTLSPAFTLESALTCSSTLTVSNALASFTRAGIPVEMRDTGASGFSGFAMLDNSGTFVASSAYQNNTKELRSNNSGGDTIGFRFSGSPALVLNRDAGHVVTGYLDVTARVTTPIVDAGIVRAADSLVVGGATVTHNGTSFQFSTRATSTEYWQGESSGTAFYALNNGAYGAPATVKLQSEAADGASAVAVIVNTLNAWSNDGAKLQSWRTNSVEKSYVDEDGNFTIPGGVGFGTYVYSKYAEGQVTYDSGSATLGLRNSNGAVFLGINIGSGLSSASGGFQAPQLYTDGVQTIAAGPLALTSTMADGASAIAAKVNTSTTWANATAKLQSWQSNGSEKASLLATDGTIEVSGGGGVSADWLYAGGASGVTNASGNFYSTAWGGTLCGSSVSHLNFDFAAPNLCSGDVIMRIENSNTSSTFLDWTYGGGLTINDTVSMYAATVAAGDGTAQPKVGGLLNASSSTVGNVGTGEDDLHSYALPADSLVETNRGLRWHASGDIANNANAKTLKVYFGGMIGNFSLPTSIAGQWHLNLTLLRSGSSAQTFSMHFKVLDGSFATAYERMATSTATETETGAITLKLTGEATSNNDVRQFLSTIEFL